MRDVPDSEIRGIARLFPTPLSKSLVFALPTSSIAVFWAVLNYAPQLWPGIQDQARPLLAISAATIMGLAVALLLLLEFIDIINKRKHTRIYHDNYTSKYHVHVSYVVVLVLVMFGIGFYVGHS